MKRKAVESRWMKILSEYPLLGRALEAHSCSAEEWALLKILYAGLDVHDVPSYTPEQMLSYVRASMRMRGEVNYAASVPEELFCGYVLPPRVNNEYLDGSRMWLYEQLRPRIAGKSMLDAALEVNYWCSEQATYQSTDDRTIAPFGICRRGYGRCGEESTLLTCALRAVGIPARQVYVPLWAHCDDNHAWVEFWAEGQWYHMGACEPEEIPDRGWFESAASRAMLVRSRVPDYEAERGYCVVNSTARYADTAKLQVLVRKNGIGVAGVPVQFQLINKSRLGTIHEECTNDKGGVFFETGPGALLVSSYIDGRLVEVLADLGKTREVCLNWEDGHDPTREEWCSQWELTPPEERLPEFQNESEAHRKRLQRCACLRSEREKTCESHKSRWHTLARGNSPEIDGFLTLDAYSMEDKELLLSTLTEKDFADVTCEALEDFLAAALPWKHRFTTEVWQKKILAPRVEHEMLLPVRRQIQRFFKDTQIRTEDEVYQWMENHIRPLPEYGLTDRRGNAAGYLHHRVCPDSEWEILAVQICRAIGIPAALNRKPKQTVRLAVRCEEPLRQGENWSLAKWASGSYCTIQQTDRLEKGAYSLITSRRQIDGTVSAWAMRFVLEGEREVTAVIQPDQTEKRLKSVHLPTGGSIPRRPGLLLFLQPGEEPTEHLLLELLELREELNRSSWRIQIMVRSRSDLEQHTLYAVLRTLENCTVDYFEPFQHYSVQKALGIGDSRLPLAIVTDGCGNGVYGCANYNIRSVRRMVQILRLLEKKRGAGGNE